MGMFQLETTITTTHQVQEECPEWEVACRWGCNKNLLYHKKASKSKTLRSFSVFDLPIMLKFFCKKIFRTTNNKIIASFKKSLDIINILEKKLTNLSSQELKNRTFQLKQHYNKTKNLQEA